MERYESIECYFEGEELVLHVLMIRSALKVRMGQSYRGDDQLELVTFKRDGKVSRVLAAVCQPRTISSNFSSRVMRLMAIFNHSSK